MTTCTTEIVVGDADKIKGVVATKAKQDTDDPKRSKEPKLLP